MPSLTPGQRLLLYFSSPRRRWAGVLVALGAYVAATYLGSLAAEDSVLRFIPGTLIYPAIFVLTLLYTHGAVLRRPVRLPREAMHRTAKERFVHAENWHSAGTVSETLDVLMEVFNGPGLKARAVGESVWVEMGKEWRAGLWRHKDAARHMKIRPAVHLFVDPSDGPQDAGTPEAPVGWVAQCRVTAYFEDRRLAGMWDVLKLSDEMAQTAVEIARAATLRGGPTGRR